MTDCLICQNFDPVNPLVTDLSLYYQCESFFCSTHKFEDQHFFMLLLFKAFHFSPLGNNSFKLSFFF